jgi:hypothetical protein
MSAVQIFVFDLLLRYERTAKCSVMFLYTSTLVVVVVVIIIIIICC